MRLLSPPKTFAFFSFCSCFFLLLLLPSWETRLFVSFLVEANSVYMFIQRIISFRLSLWSQLSFVWFIIERPKPNLLWDRSLCSCFLEGARPIGLGGQNRDTESSTTGIFSLPWGYTERFKGNWELSLGCL